MEGSYISPPAKHARRNNRIDADAPEPPALRLSGILTFVGVPLNCLLLLRLLWLLRIQRGEVLHQQSVDKDVAAADFAEEDALGAVIEEGDEL